jgi:hypothetical protein
MILKLLVILVSTIFCLVNGAGFQKDLDLNIPFPPNLDRKENIATGHLRPLGWQNKPEGAVHEETFVLTPHDFWEFYVNQSKPVVIRGLVLGSDAVDRWTDIYLNREYGHIEIRVTHRKQKNHEDKVQMSLRNFLQGYREDDWYLNVIMPDDMSSEVPLPHIMNCGPLIQSRLEKEARKGGKSKSSRQEIAENEDKPSDSPRIAHLIEPYLWISAGETSSMLHSHPDHNLHCVLDGRKDFILVPTSQFDVTSKKSKFNSKNWRQELDLHESYPHSGEWYSKINVDMVSAYKYKILQEMKWYWTSLRAGDCIYLPANHLHQARAHGRGIATSIYFTDLQIESGDKYESIKKESFNQCPAKAPLFESLDVFSSNFLWTYTHSERHLTHHKSFNSLSDARLYLLYLLKKSDKLNFEVFEKFFEEIIKEIKSDQEFESLKPNIKEIVSINAIDIWRDLLKGGEDHVNFLTAKQIFNMKEDSLKIFLQILHFSANYHNSEYNFKSRKDEL